MQQQQAPAYAPPPPDAALQQRIDTLVSYAAKNGAQGEGGSMPAVAASSLDLDPPLHHWCCPKPAAGLLSRSSAGMGFVQMMSERQGANPEFAFLRGGEGAPYFAWALHQAMSGQAPGAAAAPAQAVAAPAAPAPQYAAAPQAAGAAPPQQAAAQPAAESATAGALAGLPAEVSSGWGQVLGLLSGSRDSIRNSQAWFMACVPYAAGMAEMMLQVGREGTCFCAAEALLLPHSLLPPHSLLLPQLLCGMPLPARLAHPPLLCSTKSAHLPQRVEALGNQHEGQLHVVYLANDILFKAMSQRPAGSGPEAGAGRWRPVGQAAQPLPCRRRDASEQAVCRGAAA